MKDLLFRLKKKLSGIPNSTKVMFLLLLAALVVILILSLRSCDESVELPDDDDGRRIETTGPVEKLQDSINLPGYGSITLAAGKKEQDFCFPNPSENTVLIRISLILADGTVLWTSKDVQPGYYSDTIILSEPLETGNYENVSVRYECFSNDGKRTALNSAETKLTLKVK